VYYQCHRSDRDTLRGKGGHNLSHTQNPDIHLEKNIETLFSPLLSDLISR
jgi:hypothetical protein